MPGRRGGTLQRGNPGNKSKLGQKNAEWFQEKMREALVEGRAHEFVRQVIEGAPTEVVAVSKLGTPIMGPPRVKDRLAAVESAANRAYGKPKEHVHNDTDLTIRIVRDEG